MPTKAHNRSRRAPPRAARSQARRARLVLEELENRLLLSAGNSIASAIGLSFSGDLAVVQAVHVANPTIHAAQPNELDAWTTGIALDQGQETFFQITLAQPGNLTAQVDSAGQFASLTLYDAQGVPLVQSNGQSSENLSPLITQSLLGS